MAAIWTDVDARTRSRNEQAALAAETRTWRHFVANVVVTRWAVNAVTMSKRNALQSSITSTINQLALTNLH